MISRVCVFCGASDGARPEFRSAAVALGKALAAEGITLIYGGGRAGLMGAVADGCLLSGGKVIGVITKLLEGRELGHSGITSLHVVDTMHERKMMMANLADAFISLPGGLGTLDEMFEILAWAQLGIHDKPVGLLNTCNYYDGVMQFLDTWRGRGSCASTTAPLSWLRARSTRCSAACARRIRTRRSFPATTDPTGNQSASSSRCGSSMACLILTRNCTASAPSMMRWS